MNGGVGTKHRPPFPPFSPTLRAFLLPGFGAVVLVLPTTNVFGACITSRERPEKSRASGVREIRLGKSVERGRRVLISLLTVAVAF